MEIPSTLLQASQIAKEKEKYFNQCLQTGTREQTLLICAKGSCLFQALSSQGRDEETHRVKKKKERELGRVEA